MPAPVVRPVSEIQQELTVADGSVSRTGPTSRQAEWRGELLKTGIRGKGKQMIEFSRIEPLPGTRWLHADGETKGSNPVRVVISFGPEHAPLEQKQVEPAWEEARKLNPKPSMIVFASFHFDPEAAKDIDELTKEKTGITFLKVQMNTDLLTEDLKKQRSSNQSFWLMGRPDVEVRLIKKGDDKGKYQVEVHGFDYYNTKTGAIESDLVKTPRVVIRDDLRRRILLTLNMTKIVQHIWEAIRFENTESLVPVFDTECPIRSTGDMRPWFTGMPCEHTKRSHISHCVYDSTWEASEAFNLDHGKNVEAWVKNDHLRFHILHVFNGVVKKYYPDFLIRLKGGKTLVLEVKGQDSQENRTKREFLNEWVEAVNAHGGFGEWAWDVSRNPADITHIVGSWGLNSLRGESRSRQFPGATGKRGSTCFSDPS